MSLRWPGYLFAADLPHWLGLTRSAAAAEFTVVTAHGSRRTIRQAAAGGPAGTSLPRLRFVPAPLYLRHAAEPYWLRILARQRAVYLKYNKCLPGADFGRLAARALAVLRAHPAYRLVVDLRENPGGDPEPFGPLLRDIWDDPAINVRGRIFGLINDSTASVATHDSYVLRQATNAVLVGQQAADPVQQFATARPLKLPHYGVPIQVTRIIFNPTQTRHGIPDIVVAPTLSDWLAGRDQVLAKALAQGRTRGP